jgi:branched-chain amino acid transport system permease protein
MIIELAQQIINGLTIGGIYSLMALGLTVVYGILGIAHFAHGSFAMLGGYIIFFFLKKFGVSFFVAIALAMPVGVVLGMLIERFAYRPVRDAPPINSFIIALGLTMIIEGANLLMFGADQIVIPTSYHDVINVGTVAIVELRLYVVLTTIVLILAMTAFINRTNTGMAVRAVAQNRSAAILMGINVNRIPMIIFAISSALGIAAGAFVGALFAISPGVGEGLVIKGFAVLILGGLGSIPGAIIGGLVLGVSETLAAGFISSSYKDVIAFLVMIFVMLFRPEGLLGRARR